MCSGNIDKSTSYTRYFDTFSVLIARRAFFTIADGILDMPSQCRPGDRVAAILRYDALLIPPQCRALESFSNAGACELSGCRSRK